MGIGNLPDSTTVAAGLIVLSADFLKVISALNGSFIGRNAAGVAAASQSLGTSLYPWGNIFGTNLIIGGSAIDVSGLTAAQNRIISGAVRTTSGQPAFLDPNGAAASVDILGATTTLSVSINGTVVEVTTDISETGLTAAPAANNTAAINDTSFLDQAESKYYGEIDSQKPIITLDAVGSEISSQVGQIIALKTATSEIMMGFLKSATEFTDVKRGFMFDSSNAPIVRETLANNDTLTLLKTGWIFITNDGTTVDVSYATPVYAFTAPTGPATGDYWYDITAQVWKRYSGVEFVSINRTLLGVCVQDTSNCIGARSFDFDNDFKDTNTIDAEVFSDTVVRSATPDNSINIYGTSLEIPYTYIEFDNTADMETGSVAADTTYFLYLTTDGEPKISLERPYDRLGDLRGKYHPYNNWRYICDAKTDRDSDWLSVVSASTFDTFTKSSKADHTGLVAKSVTVATADVDIDSVTLTDDSGDSVTVKNVNLTLDMATDIHAGTEKASHFYQIVLAANSAGHIIGRFVPDLTGTADANVLNSLSATTMTAITDAVQRWDKIFQTTDNTVGYVKAVSAEGVLTCMDKNGIDLDLFPLGTEDFTIHILSPTLPGGYRFKGNVSAVYNDSGSDFDNFRQIDNEAITEAVVILSTGTGGTPTAQTFNSAAPITTKTVKLNLILTEGDGDDAKGAVYPTSSATFGKIQVGLATGVATNDPQIFDYVELPVLEPGKLYYSLDAGDSVGIIVQGYTI